MKLTWFQATLIACAENFMLSQRSAAGFTQQCVNIVVVPCKRTQQVTTLLDPFAWDFKIQREVLEGRMCITENKVLCLWVSL